MGTGDRKKTWMGLLVTLLLCALLWPAAASAQGSMPPWGTGQSRPEDLSVKLVTFSPGDAIVSWFGHSALVVEDTRLRTSRLYNYGMFSFNQAMLVKFAMGRLWFWVGDAPVVRTYEFYAREDRDVRVVELNLSPERRQVVATYLAENVLPDNRDYLYHHYFDNCATRPRDVIDLALGGQFKEAMKDTPGRMTLRDHTRRHSGHDPAMDMLLMFLMNGSIDQPITAWEEMFLPEELERQVLNFHYVNEDGERVPLVKQTDVFHEAAERTPAPDEPPTHWPWALALGLVVGGAGLGFGFWERRRGGRLPRLGLGLTHAGAGLLLGIPGLALMVMSMGTEHQVTYWNVNLLLANPLTFAAAPLGLLFAFGSTRARRWLTTIWKVLAVTGALATVVWLAGLAIPVIHQDIHLPLALILPINLGLAGAMILPRPQAD